MRLGKNEVIIHDPPVFLFDYKNWLVIGIIFVQLCLSQDLNQIGILYIHTLVHYHIQSTTHTKGRTP